MASAILRMESDCQPSSFTICHAVARIAVRNSSFSLNLRSVTPIIFLTVLAKVTLFLENQK
jgi:hypothetical protein